METFLKLKNNNKAKTADELMFLNELCGRFSIKEKGELAFNILLDYGKSRYRRYERDLSVVCKAIVLSIALSVGKHLELEELARYGSERFTSCSIERLLSISGVLKWHLLHNYLCLETAETPLTDWIYLHSAKLAIPSHISQEALSLAGSLLTEGQAGEFEAVIGGSKERSVLAASLICAASICMGKPLDVDCVSGLLGIEKEAIEKVTLLILERTKPLGPNTMKYVSQILEKVRECQKSLSIIERFARGLGFKLKRIDDLRGRSLYIVKNKNRMALILRKRGEADIQDLQSLLDFEESTGLKKVIYILVADSIPNYLEGSESETGIKLLTKENGVVKVLLSMTKP